MRKAWNGLIGLLLLSLVALAAVGAFFTPHDPIKGLLRDRLQPASSEHVLGTDQFGRDTFSRLLYGARYSLAVGGGAVGMATVVGVAIGALAAFYGGIWDVIAMRLADVLLSIPELMLAMVLVAVRGPGMGNLILAVSVLYIPRFARVMRAGVLSVREQVYVEAARATGAPNLHILARHVMPNAIGPVIAMGSLSTGSAILAGAALSFIGLGMRPPTPEWGAMLSDARNFLYDYPTLALAPGIALTVTVLGFSLVGDWLRDRFDPMSR